MTHESRQQRRARARRDAIRPRVQARITAARTAQEMWRTYYDEVLVPRGVTFDDPVTAPGAEWFRRSFYTGVAAMLDLIMRAAPDDVSEDEGVEMLQRLYEELQTYGKGLQ